MQEVLNNHLERQQLPLGKKFVYVVTVLSTVVVAVVDNTAAVGCGGVVVDMAAAAGADTDIAALDAYVRYVQHIGPPDLIFDVYLFPVHLHRYHCHDGVYPITN